MPQPFDATLKHLIDAYPEDWIRCFGNLTGPVTVEDSDFSTVSAAGDKIIRVGGPQPYLFHTELQASYDPELDARTFLYNGLGHRRYGLPVQSTVVLLRSKAQGPAVTGGVSYQIPGAATRMEFRYDLIRLWTLPAERLIAAGPGTAVLAPLGRVTRAELPEVVRGMEARLEETVTEPEADSLWASAYILMGLRYPREFTSHLLRGVRSMKESVTYQAILEEGHTRGVQQGQSREARRLLLLLGRHRLGEPSQELLAEVEAETGLERLEELVLRVNTVNSWRELLHP